MSIAAVVRKPRNPLRTIAAAIVASAVLILSTSPAPATGLANGDAPRPHRGRPVIEVLAELQSKGARIIFSSSLVPPTLVVKAEPRGRRPRQIAAEILAPYGLALKDGPGGIWLVVRASQAADAAAPERSPATTSRSRAATTSTQASDPASDAADDRGDQQLPRIEEQVDVTERAGEFAGQPSVKSLDATAVQETAGGFENVFQVLPLLPGIAATDDEDSKLAVRGTGPQHNVIVFDGVQMHSPQRLGDFPTSFVNPATTASVALDASGLDARYGGRLSSVIVLETRDGRTDRRFAVSGSAGLTSGDVLVEGRLPGTTSGSWWATVRGTYYRFVADRFEDGVRPSFGDVQFKVTVRPTRRTRLSVIGLGGREAMRELSNFADPGQTNGNVLVDSGSDNLLAAANLRWKPSERLTSISTLTAYSGQSRYALFFGQPRVNVPAGLPLGPFDRRIRIVDVAARQRATFAWSPDRVLDTGVEVHRLRNTWAMTGATIAPWSGSVGPNTWGEQIEDGRPIDLHMTRTQVGAWVQQRVPLGAGLSLEPGLRLDWNSFTHEHAVQPRARVVKRLGETAVWAGVAWQAQTPGLETVQQGFQFFDFASPEAAAVRNERSRQIVFGVEHPLTRGIMLRAEVYRRAFDRLLVQRLETDAERQQRLSAYEIPPDLPPDSVVLEYRPTVHPQSVGTGNATGLELLLQRERGRVSGWIAYTLGKSDRDLYGQTVPFEFDRRHAVGAALQVALRRSIRLGLTTQFASGFPVTPVHREVTFFLRQRPDGTFDPVYRPSRNNGVLQTLSVGYPPRVSLLNSGRLRAYARTDVRGTYTVGRHWEAYGEILNLFNRENFRQPLLFEDTTGTPVGAEREIYPSHGRLLTYGVRAKF